MIERLILKLKLLFLNMKRNFPWRTSTMSTRIRASSSDQQERLGSYLYQKAQMAAAPKEPKFKLQDIVYVLPHPGKDPQPTWPALNSEYEIDCKVLDVYDTSRGVRTYRIITGQGNYIEEIKEQSLVAAKDKHLYKTEGYKTLKEDTELCKAGTVFTKIGEYYSNDILGIYIHSSRMEEIKNLFK